MNTCCIEGCKALGAFKTRTRPTWCHDHLQKVYSECGLELIEEFSKPTDYLLTRCSSCNFEAHYRFEYVLDRHHANEAVCRACFWQKWARNARLLAGRREQRVDVSTVQQNAELHGFIYLRPLTNRSLEGDPHATCCKVCGRIEAQRNEDIGWGCPCQRNPKSATSGTKKVRGANLLKNSENQAVDWWDHKRNSDSLWETAKLKGRGEAWWICPENHSFNARIYEVTNDIFSCPDCQAIRQATRQAKLATLRGKTIADVPELLAAWDEALPPEFVAVEKNHWGSGYKFRCPVGHRNTRQPLSYLFGGCSACKGIETRKANIEVSKANPSLNRLTPEISSQWHPTKNIGLNLAEISPDSRRIVWWRDPVCGHEFRATPRERDKYERWRCPDCHSILDSLAYHYPEIAEEWSPENQRSPWEIRPNSTQLAVPPLWVCKKDPLHTWRAMPTSRVSGSRCPECIDSGKSQIEVLYCSSALERWGNAKSGARIHSTNFESHSSWTVDILVELPSDKRLAVEYDGSYWHRDKADKDRGKSLDLLAENFIVVRIREYPLPSLQIEHPRYHELTVYPTAQSPEQDLARIDSMIGH